MHLLLFTLNIHHTQWLIKKNQQQQKTSSTTKNPINHMQS